MIITKLKFLSIVFCLALASTFYNFSTADAQSAPTPNRAVQKSPTPSPSVFQKQSASPTVTPTPEEDDGGIIKIDTELVNLNVRVVDRTNRPINTLTQNDFKIYEDNVLQPIEFFSKSEVPTNYALVIDNSGSLRFQLEKVIEASKIIVVPFTSVLKK
jgi:hypothetical protein